MRLIQIPRRLRFLRASYRRRMRLLFPSPAEMKFIEIMGGRTFAFMMLRPTGKFTACMVISMGRMLRSNMLEREHRVGAMYVDFGVKNDYYRKAIEIDGHPFHDVVRDMKRDEYLADYGYQVLHIPAKDLWRNPDRVRARVHDFLSD